MTSLVAKHFFFFFNSVIRPFQDSAHYETGQSVGGAKTGEHPRKNT